MNNLFVNCNNCGVQLQIEDEIMFTTCRSCGSTLEIVRTFNSVYTKVKKVGGEASLETREESSEELVKLNVELVAISNKMDKDDVYKQVKILDKKWENQRTVFMVDGKLPNLYQFELILYPPALVLLYGGLREQFILLIILALVVIIPLTFSIIQSNPNRKAYKKAKAKYERQRSQLLNQLNS